MLVNLEALYMCLTLLLYSARLLANLSKYLDDAKIDIALKVTLVPSL